MESYLKNNLNLLGLNHLDSNDYFYKPSGQKYSLKVIDSDKKSESGKRSLVIFPGLNLSDLKLEKAFYNTIFIFTKNLVELFNYLTLLDLSQVSEISKSYISCTDFVSSVADLKLQFEKLHFYFKPDIEEIHSFELLVHSEMEEKEVLNTFEFYFLNILPEKKERAIPVNLSEIRHRLFGDEGQCVDVPKLLDKPVILFPSTLWIASGQLLRTILKFEEQNIIFFRNDKGKRKLFNETDLLNFLVELKPDAVFMLNLNSLINGNIFYFRVIDYINKNRIKVISFNFDNMTGNAKNLGALLKPELVYLFDIRKHDMELFRKLGFNSWPHFYCFTDLMKTNGFSINPEPPARINFIANVEPLDSLNKRIEKINKTYSFKDLQLVEEVFEYVKRLRFNHDVNDFLSNLKLEPDKKNEVIYICGETQRALLVKELVKRGVSVQVYGIEKNWRSHGVVAPNFVREINLVEDFYPVYRDCTICLDQLRLWNFGAFNDRVLPTIMAGGFSVLASYSKEWEVFTSEELDYYDSVEALVEYYNFYTKSPEGMKKREEKIYKAYKKALTLTPEKHFNFMLEKAGLL